ncbi:GNAT family N-acetyltransferase [Nocardioides terrisoli]|uniref:GNAT family N-acetyltransferase n=1 Tax=Nocardioides terrisoli TaxID=3388267 RepID=UPI00287B901E|nr:GNAT family N-acetyltransferase [Nocardioides marmorisolisilvae]
MTTPHVSLPDLALPDVVGTSRLRLPVITPAHADDMRAGRRQPSWHPDFPREDDLDGASASFTGGWGSRLVVRAFDGLVCGTIGCFGPPTAHVDGVLETEVGYGLVAEARGHGLATEALRALVAETDRLDVRLRASVLPDNAASVRVLAKCGFTSLRGSTDDGELVMVRPLRGGRG